MNAGWDDDGKDKAAAEMGRRGGKAHAEKMTPTRRREITRKAARVRWKETVGDEP